MKHVFDRTIAYSPREAGRAFLPPIGHVSIRDAIKAGDLAVYVVGVRHYVFRDDLIAWVKRRARPALDLETTQTIVPLPPHVEERRPRKRRQEQAC